ncbi:MAG: transposase [Mycobacterium sp.]|nr:transposase [Mycobacterium sp.]
MAIEHSILTAVWHMLSADSDYQDLGGDYCTRREPEAAMRRIIRQANSLGFTSGSTPIEPAPNPTHMVISPYFRGQLRSGIYTFFPIINRFPFRAFRAFRGSRKGSCPGQPRTGQDSRDQPFV